MAPHCVLLRLHGCCACRYELGDYRIIDVTGPPKEGQLYDPRVRRAAPRSAARAALRRSARSLTPPLRCWPRLVA